MAIIVHEDLKRRWLIARITQQLTIDEVVTFLTTVRSGPVARMWPLVVDARGVRTTMTLADVDRAVATVGEVVRRSGMRAHAALVADDEGLLRWMLEYERRCAEIGTRVIRAFRSIEEADEWLTIMSAAHNFRGV